MMNEEDAKERFLDLVPRYINGTIAPTERAWIEDYVRSHDSARNELRWYELMRQELEEPADDAGWDRLQERIRLDRISEESKLVGLDRKTRSGRSFGEVVNAIVAAIGGFFQLDYVPGQRQHLPLALGSDDGSISRTLWSIAIWAVTALGILAYQMVGFLIITDAPDVRACLAAAVALVAVVPPLGRWLNARRPKPGILHLAIPFLVGFVLSLAAAVLIKCVLTLY